MWDVFIAPLIAVIVTLIAGKFYYKHEITIVEMVVSAIVGCGLSIAIYMALVFGSMTETEVWNGEVTHKVRVSVPCEHSYEICSGSGDKRTCTTYYDHAEDYDWRVETTVGDLNIKRIDDQGSKTPPRWSRVMIGEPASIEHTYIDYVKGNADSIFHVDPNVYAHWKESLVEYPEVFDYYRIQRVIDTTGKHDQLSKQLSSYLDQELKTMGASHQLNIIVLMTENGASYSDALKFYWHGGRKNDVILFYGLDGNKVKWFNSTSFFDGFGNNQMHAQLRINSVNKEMSLDVVRESVDIIRDNFVRNPMENNKHMLLSYDAPTWVIVLSVLLSSLVSGGLSWLFGNYELSRHGLRKNNSYGYRNRRTQFSRTTSRRRDDNLFGGSWFGGSDHGSSGSDDD